MPRDFPARRFCRAAEFTGLREQAFECHLLRGESGKRGVIDDRREGPAPETDHLVDLEERETADVARRTVDEHIGRVEMVLQRVAQGRQGMSVNPGQQDDAVRRVENFIDESVERRVRYGIEPGRRLAHLRHAFAPGGGMLGALVRMQTEAHLQSVNRLGGQALNENFMPAAEAPVVALGPRHAVVDSGPEPHGFFRGTDPRQRRQITVRAVSGGILASENAPWRAAEQTANIN